MRTVLDDHLRGRRFLGSGQEVMQRGIFHRFVIGPVVKLLTQGITPEKIALSLAFGIVLGVFPLLGLTTILCGAAALIFRLNFAATQLVNYLIYPLQLFLLLPFIRLGERLFRAAPLNLTVAQILAMIRTNLPHAMATLWLAGVHATAAWTLIGAPAIAGLYFVLSRALRKLAVASARTQSAEISSSLS